MPPANNVGYFVNENGDARPITGEFATPSLVEGGEYYVVPDDSKNLKASQ